MKKNDSFQQSALKIKDTIASLTTGKSIYFKGKASLLKDIIITSDKQIKEAVCYEFISQNIFQILLDYIQNEPNNKVIQLKGGEILFLIFSTLSRGSDKEIKVKWNKYKQKNNLMKFITEIFIIIPNENEQEIQIFLKTYLRFIELEMKIMNDSIDFNEHITLLNLLLGKYLGIDNVIQFVLEITKKVIQSKKIKEYLNLNDNNSSSISESIPSIKSENKEQSIAIDFKSLINLLLKNAKESKGQKNILNLIQCLHYLMNIPDNIDVIRQENILNNISSVLEYHSNDLIIPLEVRNLLLRIIRKDDLFILIEIIKANNANEINIDLHNYNILQEIPETLSNKEDKEAFNQLKKRAITILLLIIKDQNILLYLRELNSLESLVLMLKNSLQGDRENSINMRILLHVILSLAEHYEEEHNPEISEISSNVLQNILFCCFKSCIVEINDDELFHKIMEYFRLKFKLKNINSILKNIPMDMVNYFFMTVYSKYYNQTWIFTTLHQISLSVNNQNSKEYENQCVELSKEIEILKTSEGKCIPTYNMNQIVFLMNSISLKLSLGTSTKSNEESILNSNVNDQMIFLLNKIIQIMFIDSSNGFNYNEIVDRFISLIFSALENPKMLHTKEICEFIHLLIRKLLKLSEIEQRIIDHLFMRLIRIHDQNNEDLNTMLFSKKELIIFVILCFSCPNITNELAYGLMRLIKVIILSSHHDNPIISLFFYNKGFIKMIELGTNEQYQEAKINDLFHSILQTIHLSFSNKFNEVYSDDISFLQLIHFIKGIHFRRNGTNELSYFEIMNLFMLLITKNNLTKQIVENTDILNYFIQEANCIVNYCLETNTQLIMVIFQILSQITYFLKESIEIISFDLFISINCILTSMTFHNELTKFEPLLFNEIIKILWNLKEDVSGYSYSNSSFHQIIKCIQIIIMRKNSLLNTDTIVYYLDLVEIWVRIETTKVLSVNERLFSIAYLKELILQFPKNIKNLKSKIESSIQVLDRDQMAHQEIDEEYIELEKELNQLVSFNRNNGNRWNQNNKNMKPPDLFDDLSQIRLHRRRTTLSISNNPKLKNLFIKISSKVKQLIILCKKRFSNGNKIENECLQLMKLVQILKIFSKDEENKQQLCEEQVMNSLIEIMNCPIFLSFTKNEVYLLLSTAVEKGCETDEMLKNENVCLYFINEIMNIKSNYNIDVSDLFHNKVFMTTTIIANLSADKGFLAQNIKVFNITEVITILENIQADNSIIMNLLVIMNNILLLYQKNSIDCILKNKEQFCKLILTSLWSRYKKDFRLIEHIFKVIECIKEQEAIIEMLFDYNFKQLIDDIFLEKADSTLTNNIINLIDVLLIQHNSFANLILDSNGISNIIKVANENMFNKKIIEKALSIFTTASKYSKGSIITNLGIYGVNQFCIELLNKYMVTCHDELIQKSIDLIRALMKEDYNLKQLSIKENVEVIQKLCIHNIAKEERVVVLIKILVKLITKRSFSNDNSCLSKDSNIDKQKEAEQNIMNYNINSMVKIISTSLITYRSNIKIVKDICKMTKILFRQTHEPSMKQVYVETIIELSALYLSDAIIDSIDIVFQYINDMIISEETDCYSKSLKRIIEVINIALSNDDILQKRIYRNCLDIIKAIFKGDQSNLNLYEEIIMATLRLFKQKDKYHDDPNVLLFSNIICLLPNIGVKDIPVEFLIFLLGHLEKISTSKINEYYYQKQLSNINSIADNFFIVTDTEASRSGRILLNLFKSNVKNENNISNILMTISKLVEHSEILKYEMNHPILNATKEIETIFNSLDKSSAHIQYQGKACLNNLKKTDKIEDMQPLQYKIGTLKINACKIEVKDDLIEFLTKSNIVDLYTEQGEVKRLAIKMDGDLQTIRAIEQNNEISSMKVTEMDCCVRSCSTGSFLKVKKFLGLFSKKPNPKKCFSIMGKKGFITTKRTFDVQCESEEHCIKYVDYLSILINNYRVSE